MSVATKLYYISNTLYRKHIPLLPRLFSWCNRVICSCDIPPQTTIGKGLSLPHNGLGVVISAKAVIGENCKILQQVTIGGRGKHGTPIIGNNVLIGAKASVMGGVCVGDNVQIGAHSLVLRDVPSNTTAVGIPAKIIKTNE